MESQEVHDLDVCLVLRKKLESRISIESIFEPDLFPYRRVTLNNDINHWLSLWRILCQVATIKERVIHITGEVNYVAFLLFWKRTIITVHDIGRIEEFKGIKGVIYRIVWFLLPFYCADRLVVISNETRLELIRRFGWVKNKIEMIPNYQRFLGEFRLRADIDKANRAKTILAVGTKENKNLLRLFSATDNMPNISIIVVGPVTDKLRDYLRGRSNIKLAGRVSDESLVDYYLKCDLLYFCSIYEGFGLPILEAQFFKLPVITSSISSMPEVAGEGALFVNPFSVSEIKSGIESLLENKMLAKDLVKKGTLNLERYSQKSFKNRYVDIYKSLM